MLITKFFCHYDFIPYHEYLIHDLDTNFIEFVYFLKEKIIFNYLLTVIKIY
jgi:hypothetical protein